MLSGLVEWWHLWEWSDGWPGWLGIITAWLNKVVVKPQIVLQFCCVYNQVCTEFFLFVLQWLQGWSQTCARPTKDVVTKWCHLPLAGHKPRSSRRLYYHFVISCDPFAHMPQNCFNGIVVNPMPQCLVTGIAYHNDCPSASDVTLKAMGKINHGQITTEQFKFEPCAQLSKLYCR